MIKFLTETPLERWRAETLFTKEPGTVKWIQDEAKPGDVFYDIGANIGGYTLLAARQVIPDGCVVAFEPHVLTAGALLRNLAANQAGHVQVITSALHSHETYLDFNYYRLMSGSSGSQFGVTHDENGRTFEPEARECKHATTIDHLVELLTIRRATLVKIDVDGNEACVLTGMEKLLKYRGLRSVQVEVHPTSGEWIRSFMVASGFEERSCHVSSLGQAAIDEGCAPESVFTNVIFGRVR